jgi:serine/threonine-protein kinase
MSRRTIYKTAETRSAGARRHGRFYKAWDTVMRRDVALKTILDVSNPGLLELFYKEWGVLSTMVHPNLIGIYDIGEFEHEGARKPFFVMPLLPGVTLDKLIKEGSPRLTSPGRRSDRAGLAWNPRRARRTSSTATSASTFS